MAVRDLMSSNPSAPTFLDQAINIDDVGQLRSIIQEDNAKIEELELELKAANESLARLRDSIGSNRRRLSHPVVQH